MTGTRVLHISRFILLSFPFFPPSSPTPLSISILFSVLNQHVPWSKGFALLELRLLYIALQLERKDASLSTPLGNIQRKKQTKNTEQDWSLTNHLKMPWVKINIDKHKINVQIMPLFWGTIFSWFIISSVAYKSPWRKRELQNIQKHIFFKFK